MLHASHHAVNGSVSRPTQKHARQTIFQMRGEQITARERPVTARMWTDLPDQPDQACHVSVCTHMCASDGAADRLHSSARGVSTRRNPVQRNQTPPAAVHSNGRKQNNLQCGAARSRTPTKNTTTTQSATRTNRSPSVHLPWIQRRRHLQRDNSSNSLVTATASATAYLETQSPKRTAHHGRDMTTSSDTVGRPVDTSIVSTAHHCCSASASASNSNNGRALSSLKKTVNPQPARGIHTTCGRRPTSA